MINIKFESSICQEEALSDVELLPLLVLFYFSEEILFLIRRE